MRLSRFIYRYRWFIPLAWIAVCATVYMIPGPEDPTANEIESFLPSDSPYRVAVAKLKKYFPQQCDLSQCSIIFERRGGPLSDEDKKYIERIALDIRRPRNGLITAEELEKISVISPGTIDRGMMAGKIFDIFKNPSAIFGAGKASFKNPLRSQVNNEGQAALVRVNIPANFITKRCARIVRHIRTLIVGSSKPEGLNIAVSGTAGYGYDYAGFIEESYRNTMLVTVLAIVIILLIVYRAPIGAMIPLLSIGMAAAIAVKGIDIAQRFGAGIGLAERIFVFVLMYGAGIDYSLLMINRYRELIVTGSTTREAVCRAHSATFPAIMASGLTDSLGLLMLVFSEFIIFMTTGPAVAAAIFLAILASITLVPSLVAIAGPRTFWTIPFIPKPWSGRGTIWGHIGRAVIRRPGLVLIVTLLVYIFPVMQSRHIRWVYDALEGIESRWVDEKGGKADPSGGVGNAAMGITMARRYWPVGELSPVIVMIEAKGIRQLEEWNDLSRDIEKLAGETDGIINARTLTSPLGMGRKIESETIEKFARMNYLTENKMDGTTAFRFELVLEPEPMNNESIHLLAAIQDRIGEMLGGKAAESECAVHYAGSTAQVKDIRAITQRDFIKVVILVLAVVFVIVLFLLRDIPLTVFMIAAIGLSYLSTLGICTWVFGADMDWKVQIFLFVVIAAVGVDYNIFLASRLAEEGRRYPPREAVARAVEHTGPVISSCGIIMAATLGSLVVGDIVLLQQLGTAFAIGMIIDTFLTRPLLLPAFAARFKRTGKARLLG